MMLQRSCASCPHERGAPHQISKNSARWYRTSQSVTLHIDNALPFAENPPANPEQKMTLKRGFSHVRLEKSTECNGFATGLNNIHPINENTGTYSLSQAHLLSQPVLIASRGPETPVQQRNMKTLRHRDTVDAKHNSCILTPEIAALLECTIIPRRRYGAKPKQNLAPQPIIVNHDLEEWTTPTSIYTCFDSGSHLNFLLDALDGSETLCHEKLVESRRSSVMLRSRSTDSIESISSETDSGTSLSSTSSSPPSPSPRRASRTERKMSSPSTQQVLDHPLLSVEEKDDSWSAGQLSLEAANTSAETKCHSLLKSNLTASIQALRSIARCFSQLTGASLPSDDSSTRSLFSCSESGTRSNRLPNATERRLRHRLELAGALPIVSSPDFCTVLTHALAARDLGPDASLASSTCVSESMIPMRTYTRIRENGRVYRQCSGADRQQQQDANGAYTNVPVYPVRHREPRENSDMLRIIVLEMNMRRSGKLDARAPGRARGWLPPRKNGEAYRSPLSTNTIVGIVPVRWVSMTTDELADD